MGTPLISDAPRYKAVYDVEADAAKVGNSVDINVNAALSALRNRAPVLEGSVRELLDRSRTCGSILMRPRRV